MATLPTPPNSPSSPRKSSRVFSRLPFIDETLPPVPEAHIGSGGVENHALVSITVAGFMSSNQHNKLENIESGATNNPNTDSLAEGTTKKYFTESRVLSAILAGFNTVTAAVINSGDSVLSAFQKIQAQLNTKVDKVTGKGLSSADFTEAEKNKLAAIGGGEGVADDYLLNRANHTNTQAIATVAGLQDALNSKSATGHGHNTDDLTEGSANLWFTRTRVMDAILTEFAPTTYAPIVNTDTVLEALQKLHLQLVNKVTVVAGKGLSSTDFTQAEKDKLAAIEEDTFGVDVIIGQLTAFFFGSTSDYRGDTVPNAYRRILEYRRNVGETRIYEVVAEKSINTTGVGYVLRYLCAVGEKYSGITHAYLDLINRLGTLCVAMQHTDDRKARYGGFALAPKDGTASAYNAGMVGLGLVAAYRLTLNPVFLESCEKAATFLKTLNNPNPVYSALYGVTPIPVLTQNSGWNGFCDQITASDTILASHTTWNMLATKFLKELYDVTSNIEYLTLYQNTRNWGATGLTGFYDFWAIYHAGALPSYVSNNWFATGLTVSDGQWHRRGEATPSGVLNSGACAAATATTITLAASASAVNDFYNGNAIKMTSGASLNKGSVITDYDGATKTATLLYGFPVTPTAADTYTIGKSVNTIGSDQMEYAIESLYDTGYTLSLIRTAYEEICSWANADTGAFGTAYDSRICWTGYFRPESQFYSGASKAFGTQYDVQGIGPLLKFKKEQYPDHYLLSLDKAKTIPDVATLVDKDFNTIWSLDSSGLFEYTTVGIGTVKGAIGLGILESLSE